MDSKILLQTQFVGQDLVNDINLKAFGLAIIRIVIALSFCRFLRVVTINVAQKKGRLMFYLTATICSSFSKLFQHSPKQDHESI